MSDRPRIAVAWPKDDYVAALDRAGAEVRVLNPDVEAPSGALDDCDGVLLTGGVDVDPREYGDADRHPTVDVDPRRDAYELALARLALARDLPIFAICRGVQVLNVAGGGTLIQDLPTARPSSIEHSLPRPKNALAHAIRVTPGTCLSVLLQPSADRPVAVNSRHHQSIKDPAPGFVVSAIAPDGVIEAIERPGARFCLGVQWHPENFWETGEFRALFQGFVDAARGAEEVRS
jgi:putative glutamine amidotransferase